MNDKADIVLRTIDADGNPISNPSYKVDQTFDLGMFAVSGTGGDVPFASFECLLDWSKDDALKCVDHGHAGPYPDDGWYEMLGQRHFQANDFVPYNRNWLELGRCYWVGIVKPGNFPVATPGGLLLYRWTLEPQVAGAHRVERPISVPEIPWRGTDVMSATVPGLSILHTPQPGLDVNVELA